MWHRPRLIDRYVSALYFWAILWHLFGHCGDTAAEIWAVFAGGSFFMALHPITLESSHLAYGRRHSKKIYLVTPMNKPQPCFVGALQQDACVLITYCTKRYHRIPELKVWFVVLTSIRQMASFPPVALLCEKRHNIHISYKTLVKGPRMFVFTAMNISSKILRSGQNEIASLYTSEQDATVGSWR